MNFLDTVTIKRDLVYQSHGVKTFYTIRKLIFDFLFEFYGYHLSISYRFRDIRSKLLGFDLGL